MDPRALHAFRVVAEIGSMTAAAGRLGTVQSALSARIRALEAEIGGHAFAFAFGRGCVCRERLEALLHRRHLRLRLTDLGSVDAILGCVAAGLGVALLPAALAQGAGIATEAAGQLDLVLAARPEAATIAGRLVALARAGHRPDQVRG